MAWGECNHAFHFHCIQRWLKTRNVCPLGAKAAASFSFATPPAFPRPFLSFRPISPPPAPADNRDWQFSKMGHSK